MKTKQKVWIQQVSKGRKDFFVPKNFYICSIHFLDGKPTKENPFPTLFLTLSTETMEAPTKRKRPSPRKQTDSSGNIQEVISSDGKENPSDIENTNMLQGNSYYSNEILSVNKGGGCLFFHWIKWNKNL